MPWQPFRRKVKHRPLQNEEMETCFDDNLSRSMSDGNLVRAPSERFLLSSINRGKTYGTCSGSSSLWSSFIDHTVEPGDTLAGLSLRFNLTIQDIKVANRLWTNEGLWPGRVLKIPVIEVGSTSLDLSGSCSDTMSTSSSGTSSRRLSSHDSLLTNSAGSSPYAKPISSHNSPFVTKGITTATTTVRRASVEELQDFLSKMDSSIANSRKATITMIKKSSLPSSEDKQYAASMHHNQQQQQQQQQAQFSGISIVNNNSTTTSSNNGSITTTEASHKQQQQFLRPANEHPFC